MSDLTEGMVRQIREISRQERMESEKHAPFSGAQTQVIKTTVEEVMKSEINELKTHMEHVTKTVSTLNQNIESFSKGSRALESMVNQAKGGWKMTAIIASTVGVIIAAIIPALIQKFL
jgi:hypothetical protein